MLRWPVLIFCLTIVTHSSAQLTLQEWLNIPYDSSTYDDTLRQLNLVLPKEKKSCPLMVWIGGGAWSYVDRHQEMELARRFAEQGIGVAVVGHRLSNALWRDSTLEVGLQHPVHIRDVAQALRWIVTHAAEYQFNPKQIFVGGFSSGAHLSALLVSNLRYLQGADLDSKSIRGILPISGTFDIYDYHRVFREGNRPEMAETHVEAIFGDSTNFADASPVYFLNNLKVPICLISDGALTNYTKLFENRLREINYPDLEVYYADHLGHADLWRNISHDSSSKYRKYMIDFILNIIKEDI